MVVSVVLLQEMICCGWRNVYELRFGVYCVCLFVGSMWLLLVMQLLRLIGVWFLMKMVFVFVNVVVVFLVLFRCSLRCFGVYVLLKVVVIVWLLMSMIVDCGLDSVVLMCLLCWVCVVSCLILIVICLVIVGVLVISMVEVCLLCFVWLMRLVVIRWGFVFVLVIMRILVVLVLEFVLIMLVMVCLVEVMQLLLGLEIMLIGLSLSEGMLCVKVLMVFVLFIVYILEMFRSVVVVRIVGWMCLFWLVWGGEVSVICVMLVICVGMMFMMMFDGQIVLFFGMYMFMWWIGCYCCVMIVFFFICVVCGVGI